MIKSIDKINLIGLTIIVSALILSAYTRERPEVSRYGQALILNAISPVLSLSSNANQFFSRKFGDYLLLVDTKKVNLELESRLKFVVANDLATDSDLVVVDLLLMPWLALLLAHLHVFVKLVDSLDSLGPFLYMV